MKLFNENTTRKIDSLGRVSIPKSMRSRLNIQPEDEVEFFLLDDGNEKYVCLTNHKNAVSKYQQAAEMLLELGLEIPDDLAEYLG
jgi:AbrB family looped-hinge helix DNA binding protein